MDLSMLDIEEIKYELLIRGMDVEAGVGTLVANLRKAMQEESAGARKRDFVSISTPAQEFEICDEKIKDIRGLIQSNNGLCKADFVKRNKAEAKGQHVMNRIEALKKRAPELNNIVSKLENELNQLMDSLGPSNAGNGTDIGLDDRNVNRAYSLESLNLIDINSGNANSTEFHERSKSSV